MEFAHRSVLLHECIDALAIKPDGIYLDGTLGGAGHSILGSMLRPRLRKRLSPHTFKRSVFLSYCHFKKKQAFFADKCCKVRIPLVF